jgi:hypothetical protein
MMTMLAMASTMKLPDAPGTTCRCQQGRVRRQQQTQDSLCGVSLVRSSAHS